MTENKGAFINIGPDYKLKFTKFEAVPHPNIKPMVPSLPIFFSEMSRVTNTSQAYAQNSVMSSLM